MEKANGDIFENYVIKTAGETPLYFCGTLEGFGKLMAVSPVIFGAYFFDSKEDAELAIEDIDCGKWVICNVSKPEFGGF